MGGSVLLGHKTRNELRRNSFLVFDLYYSLPSIRINIKTQELAVRREAPLILHWEGSSTLGDSYITNYSLGKDYD